MDREAWHAVIHGVAKTQTQLNDSTELILKVYLRQDTPVLGKECLSESISENIKETSASNNKVRGNSPRNLGYQGPMYQLLQAGNIQPSGTFKEPSSQTINANGIFGLEEPTSMGIRSSSWVQRHCASLSSWRQ